MRLSRLGKRKSLRDHRLDLLLLKEVEQGDQILSKQGRPQPFEPRDAVTDHPLPAREKPAADNVQPEDADSMVSMATTRSQSTPTQRGSKTINHYLPARTESLTRTPHMRATDTIKNNVYTLTREAMNFCHEVLMLVINRDSAQVGDGRRPSR